MTAALQRAIADACLGEQAGEAIAGDLRGWLEARGVAAEDVEAILAAPPRLARLPEPRAQRARGRRRADAPADARAPERRVRRPVRRGRRRVRRRGRPAHPLPARRAGGVLRLGAAAVDERTPRLPAYLRGPRGARARALRGGGLRRRPAAPPLAEVALDRALAFTESARLVRHAWAVHELPGRRDGDATRRAPRGAPPRLPRRGARGALAGAHAARRRRSSRVCSGRAARRRSMRARAEASHGAAARAADIARLLADLGRAGGSPRRSGRLSDSPAAAAPSRATVGCAPPPRGACRAAGRSGRARGRRARARARQRAPEKGEHRVGDVGAPWVSTIIAPGVLGGTRLAEAPLVDGEPLVARDVDLHHALERRRAHPRRRRRSRSSPQFT